MCLRDCKDFQQLDLVFNCVQLFMCPYCRVVENCLEQFPESYESNVKTAESDHLLIPRERHALHLCIGQQKCFLALLESLS